MVCLSCKCTEMPMGGKTKPNLLASLNHTSWFTLHEAPAEQYPKCIAYIYVKIIVWLLPTKIRMSYRNHRRTIQTGMPLDFVDEKELPGLGTVASNKSTSRVSPTDQLCVQNKSNAFLFFFFAVWKKNYPSHQLMEACLARQIPAGGRFSGHNLIWMYGWGSRGYSMIKRNTGKGHMQIYEK